MTPFDRALEFVIAHEGGYVNDPRDSGGATNMGISQRSYPSLDIKNLSYEQAAEIYRKDYWDKCSCGQFPFPLALALFDSAVNQGPPSAVRMLQKALGVREDGKVGPETIGAAQRVRLRYALPTFIGIRAFKYSLHPEVGRFGSGWYRRLAECHQVAMEPI